MILKPVFDYADPDHPNGARANRNTGDISASASAGVAGLADLRAGVGGRITVTPDDESIAVSATGLLVAFNCSARSYIFGYANAAAHVKMVVWQDGTDFAQSPYNQDVTLYDAHYIEETGDRTKTVDLSVVTGSLPTRQEISSGGSPFTLPPSRSLAGRAGRTQDAARPYRRSATDCSR
jgi:hypothetical protein